MQQPLIVPPRRPWRARAQEAPEQPAAVARPIPAPNAAPAAPMPASPTSPAQPVLPGGAVLDNRYIIEGYIGGGGFAHIYRAQDRVFGVRRAIKEAFYFDDATRRQFKLEAEFLQQAEHPNLVRGYAFFEQSGRLYLVMEFVDGQTLEDIAIEHIRQTHRALSEAQALNWMIPICDAVQALHNQPMPIIHRDVKPANIKLSSEKGIPILIDLGLAKLYIPGSATIAAALAFTPGYAPPEQYQAAGLTDPRTDVYALGATLFFLLTGYQPTESPARLTTHSLPALRALNPALSWRTERVVQRAMALNPDERYQSAAALLADLRNARSALGDATLVDVALLQNGANGSSGARIPAQVPIQTAQRSAAASQGHICAQCGALNSHDAPYCQTCGSEITLELPFDAYPTGGVAGAADGSDHGVLAPDRQPTSGASLGSGKQRTPALAYIALPTAQPERSAGGFRAAARGVAAARVAASPFAAGVLPLAPQPAHRQNLQSTTSEQPANLLSGYVQTHSVELEAAASVLALLALICVSLSLTGAFLHPMLLFAIAGIALAHWVLGVPWHAQLVASPLGDRLRQRPGLARVVVPSMPMPQEFRLVALVALVVGYLWLVLSVIQLLLSLHLGH